MPGVIPYTPAVRPPSLPAAVAATATPSEMYIVGERLSQFFDKLWEKWNRPARKEAKEEAEKKFVEKVRRHIQQTSLQMATAPAAPLLPSNASMTISTFCGKGGQVYWWGSDGISQTIQIYSVTGNLLQRMAAASAVINGQLPPSHKYRLHEIDLRCVRDGPLYQL